MKKAFKKYLLLFGILTAILLFVFFFFTNQNQPNQILSPLQEQSTPSTENQQKNLLQVVSIIPGTGDQKLIKLSSPLIIKFVSTVNLKNLQVDIEPKVELEINLLDEDNSLSFKPKNSWVYNQKYSIVVTNTENKRKISEFSFRPIEFTSSRLRE